MMFMGIRLCSWYTCFAFIHMKKFGLHIFFSSYRILLPGYLFKDDLPVLLEVNSVPMIGPDSLVNRQVTKH